MSHDKENELHEVEPVCKDSVGEAQKLAFWRGSSEASISSALTCSSTGMVCYFINDKDELLGSYKLK